MRIAFTRIPEPEIEEIEAKRNRRPRPKKSRRHHRQLKSEVERVAPTRWIVPCFTPAS